ncbi:MAG: hypothetical protein Q4E02_05590 [Lagierella massiliensis]|nr:hypothetical protein [Lagierella massiliensis]
MEDWKKFELDCTEYLNKTYGNNFSHLGFSDSTVSDIKFYDGKKSFYLEAKMPSAQSGQFVLLPNYKERKFEFSSKNKSKVDESVTFIIHHMNKNFESYANAGTKGLDINLSQDLFSSWITNSYKKNGVKFFITKGTGFIIFPVEKFQDYFNISCTYRVKKSGSSNVPKKLQEEVLKIIRKQDPNCTANDSFEIKSSKNLDKYSFSIGDTNFLVKEKSANLYRVRRLSNTKNANVIFSISLVQEQNECDLKTFIDTIR